MGGSTTYGWGADRPEDAYPARLEAYLRTALPNLDLDVVNAGIPYATTAEVFAHFQFRVLPVDPDLLVILTGGNDIDPLVLKGYREDYTHFRRSWTSPQPSFATRMFMHSPTGYLLYAYAHRDTALYRSIQTVPPPVLERTPEELEVHREREPTAFARNIESILQIARMRGMGVVLVNFKYDQVPRGVEWAIEKHRRVMGELAERYDVPLCPYETFEAPAGEWYDACHLLPAGQARQAAFIGSFLLEEGVLGRDGSGG